MQFDCLFFGYMGSPFVFFFGYIFRIITIELRALDYAKKYMTIQLEQFVLVCGYIGSLFAGLLFFGYIFRVITNE